MARHLPSASPANDPNVEGLGGLGAVVRNARARARMRIDDAAAFSGVSTDVLSRLENGKPITTDRLLKILEALGLEMLVVAKEQGLTLRNMMRSESE